MKKIDAIIRSSKFEEVKKALRTIGVNFFTFREVKGFGQQKGEEVVYRGSVYDLGYIARLQLTILTTAEKMPSIIDCISSSAATGEIGDGKIIIQDVEQVIRIRTGETGKDAL